MACPPPSRPVMIVSAAHDASAAATAASAAVPPAARISSPASAVAGWPAATAAITAGVWRSGPVQHFAVPRDGVTAVGEDRVPARPAADDVRLAAPHVDRVVASVAEQAVAAGPAG